MTQRGGVYIREGSIKHTPAGRTCIYSCANHVICVTPSCHCWRKAKWLVTDICKNSNCADLCLFTISCVLCSAEPLWHWNSWMGIMVLPFPDAAERMPHLLKGGVETRSSEITIRWSPWGSRQGQSFEEKYLAFKKFCFKACICLRSELRRVQVKCDTLLPSLVLW